MNLVNCLYLGGSREAFPNVTRTYSTAEGHLHLPFSDVHILRVLSAVIHLLYKHKFPAIMFIFPSSEWDIQTAETAPVPLWGGSVCGALRRAGWSSPPIRALHLKRTAFDCICKNV